MTDVNDFLMGGGGAPAAKFPTIGTLHRGAIVETAVTQQTDPVDGSPKTWKDGNPMMQAVITIQTDERDPDIDDDDGKRRLFVKGQMQAAVREAVKASGAGTLEIGGILAVKYRADGEKSNPAFSPPKLYEAAYAPPVADTADANDLLGVGAPAAPAQPAAQPAASLLP